MKRVLVAGATGYLGGHVLEELKGRGHHVRALGRSSEKLARLAGNADEIVPAEVTRPDTLAHVCAGIDVVFSSIGITRQRDGLSFRDVDYQGNRNLLDAALEAGVGRFVYVSAFGARDRCDMEIVRAHEDFVDDLGCAGIEHAVVRSTGFFSDLAEILAMARRGRVWLIGSGQHRVNPIHGADLAVACADAVEGGPAEVEVGGPQVMSWNEIAALAFSVLGEPARISRVPGMAARAAARLFALYDRHRAGLMKFFIAMATRDLVAPVAGVHTLAEHFQTLEDAP